LDRRTTLDIRTARPKRGLGRFAVALVVMATIGVTFGGMVAASDLYGGQTGILVNSPTTYGASGAATTNFPSTPTVAVEVSTDVTTTVNSNGSVDAGPFGPSGGTVCLAVETAGTCAAGDLAVVVTFTGATTITSGSDTFTLTTLWESSTGDQMTSIDTINVQTVGGSGGGSPFPIALEWPSATSVLNIQSATFVVTGT